MEITIHDRVKLIREMLRQCDETVHDEVTLAGNGVNTSEAGLTLNWVIRVLDGEYDGQIESIFTLNWLICAQCKFRLLGREDIGPFTHDDGTIETCYVCDRRNLVHVTAEKTWTEDLDASEDD